MSKNELLLNIYLMKERRGCLVLKNSGKPCKIFKLLEVLRFVGNMKQLSMAIDTGACQRCDFCLRNIDELEWLLTCCFVQEVVALELWFKQQLKFSWQGTAKEFRIAVDRMIARLPRFF